MQALATKADAIPTLSFTEAAGGVWGAWKGLCDVYSREAPGPSASPVLEEAGLRALGEALMEAAEVVDAAVQARAMACESVEGVCREALQGYGAKLGEAVGGEREMGSALASVNAQYAEAAGAASGLKKELVAAREEEEAAVARADAAEDRVRELEGVLEGERRRAASDLATAKEVGVGAARECEALREALDTLERARGTSSGETDLLRAEMGDLTCMKSETSRPVIRYGSSCRLQT